MKVLVTGAGGQLGHDVVRGVRGGGRRRRRRPAAPSSTSRCGPTWLGAVAAIRPDVVVHCAAWTAVDDCESDPDRAFAANADAVRWVREASELGRRPPRSRSAPTTCSTARSTGRTTNATHRTRCRCTAVRSSPASARPARTRRSCARRGCAASTVRTWCERCCASPPSATRCRSSTTSAGARRSPPIWRRCCAGSPSSGGRGIHHVTNQGAVSWYEFVRSIVSAMGKDPEMVRPIRTADLDPPRAGRTTGQRRARQRGPSRRRPAAAPRPPRAARRAGRPADGLTGRYSPSSSAAASTPWSEMSSRRIVAQCSRDIRNRNVSATSPRRW